MGRIKKMKKPKIIMGILLTVIFLIIMFVIPNKVYADGTVGGDIAGIALADSTLAVLYLATKGVALIIVYAVKILIVIVGWILQLIGSAVVGEWGIEGVIFSGVGKYDNSIVSINIFKNLGKVGTLGAFSKAVAKWYYILRFISAAALLIILIYVGIRMALATVGKDQAKYKQWLANWAVSVALLFLLQYIMSATFAVNDVLVKAIYDISKENSVTTAGMMGLLTAESMLPGIMGILSAALFAILSFQIFTYIILYIKRLITISFLMMISPLICITYSIDKIGDGKSQALNEWLKEFIYNVLVQPFHCIIYVSLLTTAFSLSAERPLSISGSIFAMFVLMFMKDAEKILRQIFHFHQGAHSLEGAAQTAAMATGAIGRVGTAAGKGIINFKNSGGFEKMKTNLDFKAGKQAREEFKASNPKSTKWDQFKHTFTKDYQDRKTELHAKNVEQHKEELTKKKYDKRNKKGAYDEGLKEARSVTDETREEYAKDEFKKNHSGKSFEEAREEIKNSELSDNQKQKELDKLNVEYEGYRTADAEEISSKRESQFKKGAYEETKNDAYIGLSAFGHYGPGFTIKGAKKIAPGTIYKNYRTYAKDAGMDKFSQGFSNFLASTYTGLSVMGAQQDVKGFIAGYQGAHAFNAEILKDTWSTVSGDTTVRLDKAERFNPGLFDGMNGEQILKYAKNVDVSDLTKVVRDLQNQIKDLAGNNSELRENLNRCFGSLREKLQNDKKGVGEIDINKLINESGVGDSVDRGQLEALLNSAGESLSLINLNKQVSTAESAGFTPKHLGQVIDKERVTSELHTVIENDVETINNTTNNSVEVKFKMENGEEIKFNVDGAKGINENALKQNPEISRILENLQTVRNNFENQETAKKNKTYKMFVKELEDETKKYKTK